MSLSSYIPSNKMKEKKAIFQQRLLRVGNIYTDEKESRLKFFEITYLNYRSVKIIPRRRLLVENEEERRKKKAPNGERVIKTSIDFNSFLCLPLWPGMDGKTRGASKNRA